MVPLKLKKGLKVIMEDGFGSWRPFLNCSLAHSCRGTREERELSVGTWIVLEANRYIKAVGCFGKQED